MKKFVMFAAIVLCLILLVFIGARYGWRLCGFNACISPTGIFASEIVVSHDSVKLKGNTSHSAPAFVGYVYEVKGNNLYVGLKYNMFWGFFKRIGAFDIQIKCDTSNLSNIYFKNGNEEKLIWEKQ